MAALDVPPELWLTGLKAAAPRAHAHNTLARMEWQRALAALLCTCTFFRDLVQSSEADPLFTSAAVARSFDWRAWRPVGRRTCTALVRSLAANRAHLLEELHLDAGSVNRAVLARSLPQLTGLVWLYASQISRSAADGLVEALTAGLPSLKYLSCTGPCQLPRLPPLDVNTLELPLLGLVADNWAALGRCVEQQSQIEELTFRVSGRDPATAKPQAEGLPSTANMLLGMLAVGSTFALRRLSHLTISQEFRTQDWRSGLGSSRPTDPLAHLELVVGHMHGVLLELLDSPCFPSLVWLEVDLQLPRDCCSAISGDTAEAWLDDDSENDIDSDDEPQGPEAPQLWRISATWEFSHHSTGKRKVENNVEAVFS